AELGVGGGDVEAVPREQAGEHLMRQANRRRPAAALTHAPEPPVGETPPAGSGLPPPLRSVRSAALERGLLLLQERLGRVLVVAGLRALVLEDGLPFQRG